MQEHVNNEIINYFCQELPDRHNLLAWAYQIDKRNHRHPEGLMYQVAVFNNGLRGVGEMCHVMIIGLN